MIKKIDIYIIKKFLASFFFTSLLFSLIAIVIDFAEKSDKFAREDISFLEALVEYYIYFIPYINGLLWPLFTLIAVIFFTSRLANQSEFISMLNAGMPFRRILRPYLITAFFIALVYFLGVHFVIPNANKIKFAFENTNIYKSNDKGKNSNVHLMIGDDKKIFVRYYRKADTSARDVRIETIQAGQIKESIVIDQMDWIGKPNLWSIKNYSIYRFDDQQKQYYKNAMDQTDTIALNLFPDDFVEFVNDKEQMTSIEMESYIQEQLNKGRSNPKNYVAELHRRSSEPVTIIILTIIGVAIASRKVRGGIGLNLALGIALGAIFVFISRFSVTIATGENFNIMLGVWLPNILFSFVALFFYLRAQQ